MKIQSEHFEIMRQAIIPLKDKIVTHREYLKTDTRVKDIEKRLRWDVFYAARLTGEYGSLSEFACKVLYDYCNDDHINASLKAIMKEIEERQYNYIPEEGKR